jgi:hypothetical protein
MAQLASPSQGQASGADAAQREGKHLELFAGEDARERDLFRCFACVWRRSLRLRKRRPVGNLRSSADSARSLLEEIPTPYSILAGH